MGDSDSMSQPILPMRPPAAMSPHPPLRCDTRPGDRHRRVPRRAPAVAATALLVAVASLTSVTVQAISEPADGSTTSSSSTSTTTTTTAPPNTAAPPTPTRTATTSTSTSTASTTTTTTVAASPNDTEPTTTAPVITMPVNTVTAQPAPTVSQPTARNVTAYPDQIEYILATIRYLESRGIYTLPPNKASASGAYQYITSTWNNYAGYAHAYLAPPEIQDQRAALDVTNILRDFDNDVSMVPVMWYYPAAVREPWRMDVVPSPHNGNTLTIREYQTRWLAVFASMSGQPIPRRPQRRSAPAVEAVTFEEWTGEPPLVPGPIGGLPSIAFPVLGPSRVAVPDCTGAQQADATADLDGAQPAGPTLADIRATGLCAAQAPGIVFGVKLQPVLAVADGIVTEVVDEPGVGAPITVTVTDQNGTSFVYAGFNDDTPGTDDGAAPDHLRLTGLARVGGQVRAGQVIGFMGDTDPLPIGIRADIPTDSSVVIDAEAVAPHIRLTMLDVFGRPIDAFGPIVDALFRQTCTVGIGQWSVPPRSAADFDAVTVETTDVHAGIDSEWVITPSGQVTASGWAAMINPNAGCGDAPSKAFGPGAAGSDQGLWHWLSPVELPTVIWVRLAMQDEITPPGGMIRPG